MVQGRPKDLTDEEWLGVYLAYKNLLHGYGKKSDMVEVVDLAGGRLVSTGLEGGTNIEVAAERLLAWNPDYIFVDHAGSSGNATAEDAIAEAVGTGDFDNVAAVQEGQVIVTPTGVFFRALAFRRFFTSFILPRRCIPTCLRTSTWLRS